MTPIFLDIKGATRFRPLYMDIVFDAVILYDKGNIMRETFERVRKRLEELGAVRIIEGRKRHVVMLTKIKPGEVFELE